MSLQVKSLKLHDVNFGNQWFDETLDRWNYDDYLAHDNWRKAWISMDCCLYNQDDNRVYLGITSFDSDIFKAYDRKSGKFVDLGFERVVDPFDAKFHRSLVKGKDGCIYAAIALLHDVDRLNEAPGGAIVKYDPSSGNLMKLGIPIPHVYIQAIALDNARDTIYCQCFAPEYFASFNLQTRKARNHGLLGSGIGGMAQSENIVLDDKGCVWCNWQVTRAWQSSPGVDAARLCKFDPEQDRLVFFKKGLPLPDGKYGSTKAEGFFNFHDGYVYASGLNGSLYRIDTETGEAKYMFTPISDRSSRLASMVLAPDGCAYGVTGRDGKCELLKFDFKNDAYELLGAIVDQDGESCYQVHNICMADDGVFYACENDNPYRSGYLWEIQLLNES